jgi:anti-sigma factor RsiW
MNDTDQLTPEEREDLVSYLDGELDAEAARALEAKLGLDPAIRQEAEALKRTWELLDYLPRPQAPEHFTDRTLERLETRQMVLTRRRRWRRWLGGLSWAGSAAAAALVGYLLLHDGSPTEPPPPSPEDIRLLEHREYWHHFEKIDGLDFLRELDRSGLFSEDS